MKKILALVMILGFVTAMTGQGIDFIKQDFAKAQQKAKAEGKPLMVYGYATWCGPCKKMKKSVFPTDSVGSVYNDLFVNVMIDMEKGDGPALNKKYKLLGYPTFLFIDNDVVVHRGIGGMTVKDFVELGQDAANPEKQLFTLKKKYEAGDRDPSFLKTLTATVSKCEYVGYEPYAKAYLDTQKDWNTEENIQFIFDYSEATLDSELFQYTLKNAESFKKEIGAEKYEEKLKFAADQDQRKKQIDTGDEIALRKHYEQYFSKEKVDFMLAKAKVGALMYGNYSDKAMFIKTIESLLAYEAELDWYTYNQVSWRAFELFPEDADVMLKASEWAKKSIQLDENSHNVDTYAWILFQLNQYDKAKDQAQKAIMIAEKEGNDAAETKELLKKINEKK